MQPGSLKLQLGRFEMIKLEKGTELALLLRDMKILQTAFETCCTRQVEKSIEIIIEQVSNSMLENLTEKELAIFHKSDQIFIEEWLGSGEVIL